MKDGIPRLKSWRVERVLGSGSPCVVSVITLSAKPCMSIVIVKASYTRYDTCHRCGPKMPLSTKEKMVAGAADLISRRGIHATSLRDVVQHTGTPRGSLAH